VKPAFSARGARPLSARTARPLSARGARRRSLAVVVLLAFAAAGCGEGNNTETDKERATPYLANATAGQIAVRAVRIVVAATATPSASPSPTGTASLTPQAYLTVSFVNHGDGGDALTNATVSGGAVQPIAADSSSLSLPPQQVVSFGDPELGATGAALAVGALATPLVPGTTTRVTFTFQSAGTTALDVPVMTGDDIGTTASAEPVTSAG
jgi:hypothetical protein